LSLERQIVQVGHLLAQQDLDVFDLGVLREILDFELNFSLVSPENKIS
jgi:hypothetical protein